jgi:hypothetical protein
MCCSTLVLTRGRLEGRRQEVLLPICLWLLPVSLISPSTWAPRLLLVLYHTRPGGVCVYVCIHLTFKNCMVTLPSIWLYIMGYCVMTQPALYCRCLSPCTSTLFCTLCMVIGALPFSPTMFSIALNLSELYWSFEEL